MPVIVSLVATGYIWQIILGPNIGMLNPLLVKLGQPDWQRDWLANDFLTFKLIWIVQAWQHLGYPIVIYLAGLQAIPTELREAARIDGANGWQVFRSIVFPLLAPAFTIVTATSFIGMFRAFDIPFILGGPGGAPNGTTDVLTLVIYREAFGLGRRRQQRLPAGVRGGRGCRHVPVPAGRGRAAGDLAPAAGGGPVSTTVQTRTAPVVVRPAAPPRAARPLAVPRADPSLPDPGGLLRPAAGAADGPGVVQDPARLLQQRRSASRRPGSGATTSTSGGRRASRSTRATASSSPALSVPLILFLSCLAGYGLTRYRFAAGKWLYLYFLSGLLIPIQLTILPTAFQLKTLHLANSHAGLIAVSVALGLPFSVFLMAGFMRTLPRELAEAAHLDGAGEFRAFWDVMLPLTRPALATVAILNGVGIWNDFFLPLILAPDVPTLAGRGQQPARLLLDRLGQHLRRRHPLRAAGHRRLLAADQAVHPRPLRGRPERLNRAGGGSTASAALRSRTARV